MTPEEQEYYEKFLMKAIEANKHGRDGWDRGLVAGYENA